MKGVLKGKYRNPAAFIGYLHAFKQIAKKSSNVAYCKVIVQCIWLFTCVNALFDSKGSVDMECILAGHYDGAWESIISPMNILCQ